MLTLILLIETGPFEDDSWWSTLMNWAAIGFLYFIYFSLFAMAMSVAFWSITARGFWSWIVAFFVAFCLAMWLGRYWGYGLCLGAMLALVVALKLYLGIGQRPENVARLVDRASSWWKRLSKRENSNYRKD